MSSEPSPLRLTDRDLFAPGVEQYLEEREVLRRAVPEAPARLWIVRVFYSTWFYLSLAGGLGAFTAWACLEPFFAEGANVRNDGASGLLSFLMFPAVVAGVGLFIGAAEGVMCRNPRRALVSAVVGLGIGFAGGVVATFIANIIFFIMIRIAIEFWNPNLNPRPTAAAFVILMIGRGAAWAVAGIPAGIGQGIALREKKVILNGLLGGVLGGLLGGLLFDPIEQTFTTADGRAWPSRMIGFTAIGLLVGLFVGLVELWTRTAWLLMRAGPLAGKQFVLYRTPTVLGSSPKADVYLFKDGAIEPRHALIHNHGGRYVIEDCDTPDGTYVNGLPVRKHPLTPGDQIVLGKTVLEFALRDAK
jgi:Inner membrane component of T3SS, cytoplasmic domain